MPDDYRDLASIMIADLTAQLPLAKDGQKAEIRRMITRWRQAQRRTVVQSKPEPKKKTKSLPVGQWRLRTAR